MKVRYIAFIVGVVTIMSILSQPASAYVRAGASWTTTATSGSGHLLGDAVTVTWSIVPDGTSIYASYSSYGEVTSGSNLVSTFDTWYGAGVGGSDLTQRPWFDYLDSSLSRMGEVSGLSVVYEPNDDGNANGGINGVWTPYGEVGVRGDIRIGGHSIDGQSGSNILAYNFFPRNGDMVIDTDNTGYYGVSSNNYLRLRNVVMHENGHGVGLGHVESDDASFMMEPYASTSYEGPQFDDILGLHRLYGDVNEKTNGEAGNDVASNATSLGGIAVGQSVVIGQDATDEVVVAGDVDFVSIDSISDTDYYSFNATAGSRANVQVTPLGPTYNEGSQGGTQTSFDASAQSNLFMLIYDTDGITLLGMVNDNGLGLSETLENIELDEDGTYFIAISGYGNEAQMYGLDLSVTPEPCSLALLTAGGVAMLRRRRK